ncbi:hypothetical protein GC177_02040 [bacterium]|nr:hypothetical protein [bacterium]
MKRRNYLLFPLTLVLMACDPVSVTYRAATFAFMQKAEEELAQEEYFQKYEEKCLWPRFNAVALARESESRGDRVLAAHYYQIAVWKGYLPAQQDVTRLRAALTPEQQAELDKQLGRHTKDNIDYCWRAVDSKY